MTQGVQMRHTMLLEKPETPTCTKNNMQQKAYGIAVILSKVSEAYKYHMTSLPCEIEKNR